MLSRAQAVIALALPARAQHRFSSLGADAYISCRRVEQRLRLSALLAKKLYREVNGLCLARHLR